jgi:phospholipid/cholesterol/gamma-HCH transport system permease protein
VKAYLNLDSQPDRLVVSLRDDWVFDNVPDLEEATARIRPNPGQHVTFQCGALERIDIAGAWVLYDRSQQLSEAGFRSDFAGFRAAHFKFLRNIIDMAAIREYEPGLEQEQAPGPWLRERVEDLGEATISRFEDLGDIAGRIVDGVRRPSLLIIGETIRQLYQTGVQAIPVVMIITFLVGIVMAYQASGQLEQFGARIYVVDLVSIAVMREMSVLMAAVMVAGRSGSAFAAALGTMKLNEEVDAFRVLGLNPNQILVLPRILGLVVALPLLTVLADVAGIAGGALIAVGTLDIGAVQFIERVASSTDLNDFYAGLVKAPFFAFLIAAVGTLRGMQVRYSAEELGRNTTIAVVQAIFLIILADAFFTMLFTRIGF